MSTVKWLMGALPVVQKSTSSSLGGFNPAWHTGVLINPKTGRKLRGVPIGHYATFPTGKLWIPSSGGDQRIEFGKGETFLYDNREFKASGLKKNLNRVFVGEIGMGKSGEVKLEIKRGTKILGLRYLYIDPKGEGEKLVEAIPGAQRIEFGKETKYFLNPMDPLLDPETMQLPLIKRLILIAMADKAANDFPTVRYHNLLWEGIQAANRHYGHSDSGIRVGVPTLPTLLEYLQNPTSEMAANIGKELSDLSPETEYGEARDLMAQGLIRYISGDLKGFLHRETSEGLFTEAPLLDMDCKNLSGDQLPAVVVMLHFMATSKLSGKGARQFDEVISDETWKLSQDRRFVDTQREGQKLGRTEDIGYTSILHNLADWKRSSFGYEAVTGLITDCDEVWIFSQTEEELDNSANALGVNNETMRALIPNLAPHTAVVRVGKTHTIVKPYARADELPLLETNPEDQ
jgi:hypothetical protein